MKNKLSVFRVISRILLVLDILLALFFFVSFVMVMAKLLVLNTIHFVLFSITIGVNLIYAIYLLIVLIKNRGK